MVEYLTSGAGVDEKDAGPVPIKGDSTTSTSGTVGFTLRDQSRGKPPLVTSYVEFVCTFGGVNHQMRTQMIPSNWSAPCQQL